VRKYTEIIIVTYVLLHLNIQSMMTQFIEEHLGFLRLTEFNAFKYACFQVMKNKKSLSEMSHGKLSYALIESYFLWE